MTDKKKQDTQSKNEQAEQQEKENKPKGLIRIPGIAALAITVGTIGAGGYFFADTLAKTAIQKGLELSIGAQTDIEEVNVSFSPFGLTIQNLQQTDPSAPNQNLFAFETFSAQANLWEFMLGKYVVETADISKLQLGSARVNAGEVFASVETPEQNTQEKAQDGAATTEPSEGFDIPSADDLLAKLDLQTEKKGKELSNVWKQEKQKLDKAFADLPDKKALASLKQDWKRLKSMDIKSLDDLKAIKKELKQVKAKIDANKDALKHAQKQYKESKNNIDVAYDALEQAAKDDWQKVESQIPLDDPNAVAISKMLFGNEVAEYVATAQEYWQKAQPYIEQHKGNKQAEQEQKEQANKGRNIEFPLENVYPDWIVNQLNISVLANNEIYQISAQEVNVQSYVRGKPTEYQVKWGEQFNLTGDYFVAEDLAFSTSGDWQIKQYKVKDKSLSDSNDLSLRMASADVNGDGKYQYQDALTSNTKLKFTDTQFVGDASTKLAKLTLDTLTQVQTFNVNLGVKGQLSSPDVSVRSNLDTQLNKAFKNAFNSQWKDVKQDAKAKVENQLKSQLNVENGDLDKWRGELSKLEKDFKDLGNENVDVLAKKKADAYKKKLEKEAKDKLDKEKKKAEDKLKDKLKKKLKDFKCCE